MNKALIALSTIQVLKWFQLAIGLLAVAVAFAAVSFGGYLSIHELKEKEVKRIQKKRLQAVRDHLSKLAKKCAESKEVTDDIEDKFYDLFLNEYDNAYEPMRILNSVDRFLLFSGILFLGTIVLDWANENSTFILSQGFPLQPLEIVLFIYGIVLLAIGLLNLERLRRITAKEEDIDPPPFDAAIFVGLFLAVALYFLWITASHYSNLTPFGRALFYSSFLPFIGAAIAIIRWEKKDWKRTVGLVLLFSPFFLIVGWIILAALNIL